MNIIIYNDYDYGAEECDFPIAMALHIFVFVVEKLESDKGTAQLSIKYLRRQAYEFKSEDEQLPYFTIKKGVM